MQEQLIEAVRKNSVLYDTSHEEYLKSKLKDEVWNRIAGELNLKDGNAAKSIWIKLRNSYREALRRQKSCFKSGSSAVVIKFWKYQKQMQFLQPYMANRLREGNLEHDSENEITQEQFENTDAVDLDSENMETDMLSENLPQHTENIIQTENLASYVAPESDFPSQEGSTINQTAPVLRTTSAVVSKSKGRKDDICSLLKESIQQREKRAQERELQRKKLEQMEKSTDDEMYHFYMSMYKITKKMPPAYQHTIRNNIFQIVSQVEADYLQINDNQTPELYSQQVPSNPRTLRPYLQPSYQFPSTPQTYSSCAPASDNTNMSFSPSATSNNPLTNIHQLLLDYHQAPQKIYCEVTDSNSETPRSYSSSNGPTPMASPVDTPSTQPAANADSVTSAKVFHFK